jgi:hypothetical protein
VECGIVQIAKKLTQGENICMKKGLWKSATIIFCMLFCAVSSQAQFDAEGRWINGLSEEPLFFYNPIHTLQNVVTLQTKWRLIEEENALSKDHEWAGDYVIYGETGSVKVLRWSVKEGFVFLFGGGCEPSVRGLNYGKVAFSKNLLRLFPEVDAENPKILFAEDDERRFFTANFIASKFVPVKWQGIRYLVAENQVEDFYDYVAGVGDYAPHDSLHILNSFFFPKKEERDESATGNEMPVLPSGYERFVKKPVDAEIITVGRSVVRHFAESEETEESDEWVIPVTLNVGTKDGVKLGMTFAILQEDVREIVKITRVGTKTSKGEIISRIYSAEDDKPPVIKTGWRVSTASYKKY